MESSGGHSQRLDIAPSAATMRDLFAALRSIQWSDPQRGAEETLDALSSADLRAAVADEVSAWEREGLGIRELLSHDTGTHLKWFVAYSATNGVVMWLHQYKPSPPRTAGYAHSVHNHRYWFVSSVLYGGYEHLRYRSDSGDLSVASRDTYSAPDSYIMTADEIHSVEDIRYPTVTLIVQGPAIRHTSIVYGGQEPKEFPDFEARIPLLAQDVKPPAVT